MDMRICPYNSQTRIQIFYILIKYIKKIIENSMMSPFVLCKPIKIQAEVEAIQCKIEQEKQKSIILAPIIKLKKKRKEKEDEEYQIRRHYSTKLIRWSPKEDLIYIQFMINNTHFFGSENLRRAGKVFMQLSKIMEGSRTPNQCKSHHQKMQKATANGTIEQIVEYLQAKHGFSNEQLERLSLTDAYIMTDSGIEDKNEDIEHWDGSNYNIYVKKKQKILEIKVLLDGDVMSCW